MSMGNREDSAWNGTDEAASPVAILKATWDLLDDIKTQLMVLPGQATAYTTVVTGEIGGGTAAAVCGTAACKLIRFKASGDNAGTVYLGAGTAMTKADGTTDATTGLQLRPGDDTGWIPADNLSRFFRIADNAGDDLTFMIVR